MELTGLAVWSDGVQRTPADARVSAVADTRTAVVARDVRTRLRTALVYTTTAPVYNPHRIGLHTELYL